MLDTQVPLVYSLCFRSFIAARSVVAERELHIGYPFELPALGIRTRATIRLSINSSHTDVLQGEGRYGKQLQ